MPGLHWQPIQQVPELMALIAGGVAVSLWKTRTSSALAKTA